MAAQFPHLFSPFRIGPVTLKNRIMSTAHQTTHVEDYLPTRSFLAYHRERARGGAGLIILEAHSVLPDVHLNSHTLSMARDEIIPWYQELARMVAPYDTRVFVQIGHTATETYASDYTQPPTESVSAVPTDRFKLFPVEMSRERIRQVVEAFGAAADRVRRTGLHGVELLGSHGYLISQFWSAQTNQRTDEYGGDLAGRMRFVTEVLQAVRAAAGPDLAVGIRLSMDEMDGLGVAEMVPIVQYLERLGLLDYINVVLGTSRQLYGCTYIVPPTQVGVDEVRQVWQEVRQAVRLPILAASRHKRPAEAEEALASGLVDVVGMTRALISDPHLPNKARAGRLDEILYCIGCNQSCIGRYQLGLSLHCLQNPITGREERFGELPAAERPRRVLVIGGGPAGLQAAATAARRGHRVTLVEREGALGGAARLVAAVPGRAEFAGLAGNLERQARLAGVDIILNTAATPELVRELGAEAVILATGADPYRPAEVPGLEQPHVVPVTEALAGRPLPGRRVLVADWRGDWPAMDAAVALAGQGYEVELVTAHYCAGEKVQQYVRHKALEALYRLGVRLTPHYRLAGVDGGTVRLQNLFTLEYAQRQGVDAVIISLGGRGRTELWEALQATGVDVHRAGDCLAPRSAEEAVWEGFQAGLRV